MPSHIELRRRIMARRRREQAAAREACEQREREAQGAAQLLARLNNPPVPSGMAGIMERLRREGAAALASIEDAPQHDDMVDTVTMAAEEARRARADAAARHLAPTAEEAPVPISLALATAIGRLPPIIDDPFVPTPEQGEALERIEQLKKLIGLRGFGSKRKALEQRLAKLMAELPANALPDDPRLARRPAITEMRVLDPAQAGAPGGTVLVQTVDCADPTRVAGEQTVQVRGAIDSRTLRDEVGNVVSNIRRIYRPAHAPDHE